MDYRKVYSRTPAGSESLCETCSHAHVVKGSSESEQIVVCQWPYPAIVIPFRVSECSHYANGRLPDVEDLEEIAWDLTRQKSARAGFRTGHSRQADRQEEAAVGFGTAARSQPEDET
jgi:hypothetical protein